MLTITRQAAAAITQILETCEPRGRVLRIVERPLDEKRSTLALALSRADPTDLVVAERGIQVFLELELAERLEGKRLHARREGGQTRFLVE